MNEKENKESIIFLFIVPTLNSYKDLPKLLISIKEQEYKYWKIIFVDGKSFKSHKKWLKEYCSKDERLITIEENKIRL